MASLSLSRVGQDCLKSPAGFGSMLKQVESWSSRCAESSPGSSVRTVTPRYAVCRGGAHDNERWPLSRSVDPGHQFNWGEGTDIRSSLYAVEAEIVQTNLGPMWVAIPA